MIPTSVLAQGDIVGGVTIVTELAVVLGVPDTGAFYLVGGTRKELQDWVEHLRFHLLDLPEVAKGR